jgi:hypothetical protein
MFDLSPNNVKRQQVTICPGNLWVLFNPQINNYKVRWGIAPQSVVCWQTRVLESMCPASSAIGW